MSPEPAAAPLHALGARPEVDDVGQAPLVDQRGDVRRGEGVEGVTAQQHTEAVVVAPAGRPSRSRTLWAPSSWICVIGSPTLGVAFGPSEVRKTAGERPRWAIPTEELR